MKNLAKIFPVPNDPLDDYLLEERLWGNAEGFALDDFGYNDDSPVIVINGRYIIVTKKVWNEVASWNNINLPRQENGMILHLSDEDAALYILVYT